jgi:carboxylesterase
MNERMYRSPEPFFLQGHGERRTTLLLMIHGFTGSPSEFRRLGFYLNDLGYTVNAIRLPGHGTTPEEMIKTRWTHWWDHVLTQYEEMKQKPYRRIIAAGHSMGGLLALKLAAERQVDGVISLAAPIYLWSRKTALAVLLQYFIRYVEKYPANSAIRFEEACAYTKTPVPCVVSLRKLLKMVKKQLPWVQAPLFIAQGGQDRTVQPRSAAYISDHAGSKEKEIAYYPGSSHALLLDNERERVYADIHRFIWRLEEAETLGAAGNLVRSQTPDALTDGADYDEAAEQAGFRTITIRR